MLTRQSKEELLRLSIENAVYQAQQDIERGFGKKSGIVDDSSSEEIRLFREVAIKASKIAMEGDEINGLLSNGSNSISCPVCNSGLKLHIDADENQK